LSREYADTAEPLQTVKVKVEQKVEAKNLVRRNEIDSFYSEDMKSGTYNVMDEKSVPVTVGLVNLKEKKLQKVSKPVDFVAPTPKTEKVIRNGISVLPGLESIRKPSKPIILFDYEANGECQRVREACTMLDICLEIKPCPGLSSFKLSA
jgi:hypothetical protein